MSVKYTPEMLAKMGLKIHGEAPDHPKTRQKDDVLREGPKKRQKQKVSPQGTDCRFFILLLKQELGVEAVEEHVFHEVRKWRFDVAILSHRIAIEIEGGVWRQGGGAHSHPSGIIRDIEKYNAATIDGWKVLRVVPEDLTKTKTIKMIKKLTDHET